MDTTSTARGGLPCPANKSHLAGCHPSGGENEVTGKVCHAQKYVMKNQKQARGVKLIRASRAHLCVVALFQRIFKNTQH